MDSYPQKQFKTSRGFTYNYIHLAPPNPSNSTILFLHGFPSSLFDWRHQISYFSQKGYGILAPECLGYGKSSKPLGYQAYSGKGMTDDVKEILDHEKIPVVIGVAHDWGSYLLSRLVNYYPECLSKLVFLDVGYSPPGQGLTKERVGFVNEMVQKHMGYSVFGYFLFFDEEDAAALMDKNIDSCQSLFHTSDPELIKKYMGAMGGFRTWCEEGMTAPKSAYINAEDREDFRKQFSPANGGFAPALNWYRAGLHDINAADDAKIPEENHKIKQPTLLFTGLKNPITASADFPNQMKPNVPDLEAINLETGHWMQLEATDLTNEKMRAFFEK